MSITCVLYSTRLCAFAFFSALIATKKNFFFLFLVRNFFNDFVTSSSVPLIRLRASGGKIELMSLLFNCVPFYNFFFFVKNFLITTRRENKHKLKCVLTYFFIVIEHFVAKFSNKLFLVFNFCP